jgi:photosystem II stability/assembly factor-like uncharacterized protein
MPKGAEKLDFRGVQGFDAKTAVVMSSGKGALSKIYKTTDGCQTWKLVFENPDATGFFDALKRVTGRQIYLLGDPVDGKFSMFFSDDRGDHWYIADDPGREAGKEAGAFAASNSSFASVAGTLMFGTGATATEGPKIYRTRAKCPAGAAAGQQVQCSIEWVATAVPMGLGSSTLGVFSLAGRTSTNQAGSVRVIAVAVGGDYGKPEDSAHSAAFTLDGGEHWQASVTMPGGYRSAVEYAKLAGKWIAVGPAGSDVSKDDGKNWTALKPGAGEAVDADKGWNAVSLPFVVGAKGKIGKLRDEVLK